MAAEGRTRRLDRAVAALAERQHAVVAWLQLAMLGMTRHGLHTRVAAGRLHRLHRGVYSVVARRLLRIEGHWLAAVFAVGGAPCSASVRPTWRSSSSHCATAPACRGRSATCPLRSPTARRSRSMLFWSSAALAVELGSRGFHSSWRAQVKDRRRDAQLTLAGLKAVRFPRPISRANAEPRSRCSATCSGPRRSDERAPEAGAGQQSSWVCPYWPRVRTSPPRRALQPAGGGQPRPMGHGATKGRPPSAAAPPRARR